MVAKFEITVRKGNKLSTIFLLIKNPKIFLIPPLHPKRHQQHHFDNNILMQSDCWDSLSGRFNKLQGKYLENGQHSLFRISLPALCFPPTHPSQTISYRTPSSVGTQGCERNIFFFIILFFVCVCVHLISRNSRHVQVSQWKR